MTRASPRFKPIALRRFDFQRMSPFRRKSGRSRSCGTARVGSSCPRIPCGTNSLILRASTFWSANSRQFRSANRFDAALHVGCVQSSVFACCGDRPAGVRDRFNRDDALCISTIVILKSRAGRGIVAGTSTTSRPGFGQQTRRGLKDAGSRAGKMPDFTVGQRHQSRGIPIASQQVPTARRWRHIKRGRQCVGHHGARGKYRSGYVMTAAAARRGYRTDDGICQSPRTSFHSRARRAKRPSDKIHDEGDFRRLAADRRGRLARADHQDAGRAWQSHFDLGRKALDRSRCLAECR